MPTLNEQFGVCVLITATGFLIKTIYKLSPPLYAVLSKVLFNATLPSVLFLTFARWRRVCDRSQRASFVSACSGLNLGLFFYPIMQGLYGDEGLMLIAFVDLPNGIIVFTLVHALYYLYAPKPTSSVAIEHASLIPSSEVQSNGHQENGDIEMTSSHQEKGDIEDIGMSSGHQEIGDHELAASQVTQHSTANFEPAASFPSSLFGSIKTAVIGTQRKVSIWLLQHPRIHIVVAILIRTASNPPLWASPIGMVVGLSGVKIPSFIELLLSTLSSANGTLAFFVLGMCLDFKALRTCWATLLRASIFRYVLGSIVGVAAFMLSAVVSPGLDRLVRLVLLVAFVMPSPLVGAVFSLQYGHPTDLPGLVVSSTIIISFGVVWAMMYFAGY
ncbi:hypothetical protein Pelo_6615 [Pelomyxa schiedti]|nr:hypothetical protein Pelo_6615 [Pelomyxa schiedti]